MYRPNLRFPKLFFFLVIVLYQEVIAQPLVFVASEERVKNKNPFAGGTACCNCKVRHYGNLPADFPAGKVFALTFYLLGSRSNSYYNTVQDGPTELKLVMNGRECIAISKELPDFMNEPVRHKWLITFPFDPPVYLAPQSKWELIDGDNNIYSAVLLHASDSGLGDGLPGVDEQTGCQYNHKYQMKYSVKIDFSEQPLISMEKERFPDIKLRDKILKTAIVEFTERGDLGIKDAGSIIAEWMTTALNQTGVFEVYERLSLNKLMEEHQMAMTGIMDEETIAQIGKIHGVEAIVTGSVFKFGDVISVTVKLIDTETAKLIDTADIKVSDVNRISLEIGKLAHELAIE